MLQQPHRLAQGRFSSYATYDTYPDVNLRIKLYAPIAGQPIKIGD